MANNLSTTENGNALLEGLMFGRLDIYTGVKEITKDNVLQEVQSALNIHNQNMLAEDYLYWYRRGLQPILYRHKERNSFINNKVVENHAGEIVDFKNGYFLTQPAFYVTRSEDESKTEEVKKLNEYLYRSGKQIADNNTVDWFHTVGKGYTFIQSIDDEDIPFRAFSLDPRSTCVVKSMGVDRRPVYALYIVTDNNKLYVDCYTRDFIYRLSGTVTGTVATAYPNRLTTVSSIDNIEPNMLGIIPIFEYSYNSVNMGSFESVLSLLDTLNGVQSNRFDAIEQAIQSLLVFYNCELEDETDEEGNTINKIRKNGAIFLKSIGENKADIKEIATNLNQQQTQVLVDYLYDKILSIVGLPTTTKGGTSTSDTGTAVYLRDGYSRADTVARNTEDLFKQSNRGFDIAMLRILKEKGLVSEELKLSDFELNFTRNEVSNVQSRAQAFQTLLAAGLHPILAAQKSGISNDPNADIEMSKPYLDKIWGNPFTDQQGEAEIVNETRAEDTTNSALTE